MKAKKEINLFELFYRDYKNCEGIIGNNPSKATIKYVMNTGKKLSELLSDKPEIINFSDVIYDLMPIANNKNNGIKYEYVPMLSNGKMNVHEYIGRYNNFIINKLPLIEIAEQLKIKVEKSNVLEEHLGLYNSIDHKITLGSDYKPFYLHELAHAIDYILPEQIDEYSFKELIAEFTAVVLCRNYKIQINTRWSWDYLSYFTDLFYNHYSDNTKLFFKKALKRVALIYEFVKERDKPCTER